MAIFERSHLLQTVILGIYVSFRDAIALLGSWTIFSAPSAKGHAFVWLNSYIFGWAMNIRKIKDGVDCR